MPKRRKQNRPTWMKEPLPICDHLAHPKFRAQNENLTSCVRMPDHAGNHVYCVKVTAGVDPDSHALHYHEELNREILKPVMIAEMAGREVCDDEQCAAVYQFMEWQRTR